MKNAWTIVKKEFRRYFTDPRMLSALFLPGILIFALYMLLGTFLDDLAMPSVDPHYSYRIAYSEDFGGEGRPSLLRAFDEYLSSTGHEAETTYVVYASSDIEDCLTDLKEGELDIVVRFSTDFEAVLETAHASPTRPNIDIYYDASVAESESAYQSLIALTSVYDSFTVNAANSHPNVGGESFTMSSLLSFIFPMVVMTLLFSSCLSICPESIAGEKERGTIATLLITPIKPYELALGKIASLSVLAVLSGTVSALGLVFSLPFSLGGMSLSLGIGEVVALFFAVIAVLLMLVAVSSFVSAFARSVKEATSYLGPMTAVLIILSIVPMLADLSSLPYAFIPFLNVIYCMGSVFSTPVSLLYWVIAIVESLLVTALFLYLSVRLFRSEKAMFG